MVVVPDGLVTAFYLPYLGLRPKAAHCNATRCLFPLPGSLLCHSNGHFVCIFTNETIPWGQFQIRVGCILPQFILGSLITTMISDVLTVVLFSTSRGTHCCHMPLVVFWAVIHHPAVCCALCWLWLQWFWHEPSYQADQWGHCCGGESHFVCWGSTRSLTGECPTGGVVMRGMFDRGRTGRGRISVWCTGQLIETRVCEPPDSEAGVTIETPTLHCTVVASASLI